MSRFNKKRKKGKKSIRKLKHDEDFFQTFGVEMTDDTYAEPVKPTCPKQSKQTIRKPLEKKEKNGIRILSGDEDLIEEMAKKKPPHGPSESETTAEHISGHGKDLPFKSLKKNRHGVVVLEEDADLAELFSKKYESSDADTEFSRLIEDSLSGKSQQELLREKKSHRTWHKPTPLKQRLKRYPASQEQLDLHGYTSAKAEYRTRSWIYNHYINGTYTVRIITGKGLHSEAGAVLPDIVEMKLRELKKNGIVLAWEWEKKTITNSGSVTVYLVAEPDR